MPVLGVNLGRLAFLAEVNLDELPEALDRIDRDEHWLEERAVMTVSGTCFPMTFSAFNDSALSRVPGNGPAALAVEVEGEVFARYTADALVIATPTGSTAYSFAAGGPIVSPRHRGLLVTPVAPHAAFDRACFLHPDEDLRVHVLDRSAPLLLEADGQRVAELQAGDCIQFTISDVPARILRLQPQGFYERARRKLQLTDSSELAPVEPGDPREGHACAGIPGEAGAGVSGGARADERPAPHRARARRGRHRPAPPVVAAAAARRARGGADRPLRPARAGLRLHAPDRGPDRRVPAGRRAGSTSLHVGGGACALPRYVAATRPKSRQLVLELDPGVVALAREHLGLRATPRLRIKVGDAAELITARYDASADLVIGDAFDGPHVPAQLSTRGLRRAGPARAPARRASTR